MYLTPGAISYLTQLILAAMIGGYFAFMASRRPDRPRHTTLLAWFFVTIAGLSVLLFLDSAFLPTQRLVTVCLESTVLGIGMVLLVQFAYHFPELPPGQRREAGLALAVSGLYALWEAGLAVYRLAQLGAGRVLYRPDVADLAPLLLLAWVPIVLGRRVVALSAAAAQGGAPRTGAGAGRGLGLALRYLWRPQGRPAQAARAFAAIYSLPAGLGLLNILLTFYLVSRASFAWLSSLGMLFALFAFAAAYLNYLPETTSFMVKLAGGTLTAMLAVLGLVGWAIAPAYAAHYHPDLPDQRTLRFTPNTAGGYTVAEEPLRFETGLGEDLKLTDSRARSSAGLAFAFPFYGQTYAQVYVSNDGTISLGQAVPYRNYQYHYGARAPLICGLLMDLDPEAGAAGVFARQEGDRLIVTWWQVPAYYRPQDVFTFQAVLYRSGAFELSYNGLPASVAYVPNDEPGATPWLVGALPGSSAPSTGPPQLVSLAALPWQGGRQGLVQDYALEFRRYLHEQFFPLALLILAAGLLVVVAFPLLFQVNLIRPLEALLGGMRQINAGQAGVSVEIYYPDEIGFLTRSFNAMSAEMAEMIRTLESRVEERTAELQLANARLAQEVAELDAFAHTVAHDLKSPLTIIAASTDLLSDHAGHLSPEELQGTARMASSAAFKASEIIDSLLLLARTRKANVATEPVLMPGLVREAQQRLARTIEDYQVEMVPADWQSWPITLGYGPWIVHVWENYIANAIKYGGRPPRVEVGASGEPDGQVRFWVRDNGPGLDAEQQARLFTPFERLGQTRVEGHGLGLSIAKRIVEKLGGQVGVESTPGQGSLFYFTLPATGDED